MIRALRPARVLSTVVLLCAVMPFLFTPGRAVPGPARLIEKMSSLPSPGRAEYENLVELLRKPALLGLASEGARERVFELVSSYAPRYWFHEADEGPSDPLHFIGASSLWLKKPGSRDLMLLGAGRVTPAGLVSAWNNPGPARPANSHDGGGLYLKLEAERGSRRVPARADAISAPLLWKFGRDLGNGVVLLEYWFHADHSAGKLFGIGEHQGDWEGVAALVQLAFPIPGVFTHRLLAMYFAAHEGGEWGCADRILWSPDETGRPHPEAFSALGSHATYATPGTHWNRILTEATARGRSWDSWKNLRALAIEPYSGYSGGWGDTGRWSFMSGPMPPGNEFKSMPRGRSDWFRGVAARCRFTPISSFPASE